MKNIKKLLYILVLILLGVSSLSYAEETDQQSGSIIKLYPNITGDFWSFLKGTKVELLNQKSKHNYSFWSFSGSMDDSDASIVTDSNNKQWATAYSLAIGYGTISYVSHNIWDSFNKNKIAFSYRHMGLESANESSSEATSIVGNNSDTYALTYVYSLGVEKTIIEQFRLGVEADVFDASISYNRISKRRTEEASNVVTADSDSLEKRWGVVAQLLGAFRVYATVLF